VALCTHPVIALQQPRILNQKSFLCISTTTSAVHIHVEANVLWTGHKMDLLVRWGGRLCLGPCRVLRPALSYHVRLSSLHWYNQHTVCIAYNLIYATLGRNTSSYYLKVYSATNTIMLYIKTVYTATLMHIHRVATSNAYNCVYWRIDTVP